MKSMPTTFAAVCSTSLTVANSSSSDLTLGVMLVIAIIGVPLVAAYTIIVYRTFAGKVKAGEGY